MSTGEVLLNDIILFKQNLYNIHFLPLLPSKSNFFHLVLERQTYILIHTKA